MKNKNMGETKFEKIPIGKVDQWLIDEAKEIGLDIDGFEHEITNHFVAHVMKRHGNEKREAAIGQVAIKEADFKEIPAIIKSPNHVIAGGKYKSGSSKGKNFLAYAKEMADGTTLYFEEVLDGKDNKSLRGKTMYKRKGATNEEKFFKTVSNADDVDISNAKIISLAAIGGYPDPAPTTKESVVVANPTQTQGSSSNISQYGEKSSGFTAAETGNPPPLERRNFNSKENYMSAESENNSEKILDWSKNLGEQSEYVKKAIEPLLTWEFAYSKDCIDIFDYRVKDDYKSFWETKNKKDPNWVKEHILKFSVGDLYDELSPYGMDDYSAVKYLKSIGIEGEIFANELVIFDDKHLKPLDMEAYYESEKKWINEIEEKWNVEEDVWIKNKTPYFDEILKHNFENLPGKTVIFGIRHADESNGPSFSFLSFSPSGNTSIWRGDHDVPQDSDLKKTVENMIKHFSDTQADEDKMDLYVTEQVKILRETAQTPQPPSVSERNYEADLEESRRNTERQEAVDMHEAQRYNETAKKAGKAGYVQGVCESILAFNTDEHMKFMSEATMTFLSKKLLSEMNVTKNMAKKFANPETYKALEQYVFAPKQEQQFEQQQSRRRGR